MRPLRREILNRCRQSARSKKAAWPTATADRRPPRRRVRAADAARLQSAARIRGMLAVRDAVREVFRTQLEDAPDGTHHRGAPAI